MINVNKLQYIKLFYQVFVTKKIHSKPLEIGFYYQDLNYCIQLITCTKHTKQMILLLLINRMQTKISHFCVNLTLINLLHVEYVWVGKTLELLYIKKLYTIALRKN